MRPQFYNRAIRLKTLLFSWYLIGHWYINLFWCSIKIQEKHVIINQMPRLLIWGHDLINWLNNHAFRQLRGASKMIWQHLRIVLEKLSLRQDRPLIVTLLQQEWIMHLSSTREYTFNLFMYLILSCFLAHIGPKEN